MTTQIAGALLALCCWLGGAAAQAQQGGPAAPRFPELRLSLSLPLHPDLQNVPLPQPAPLVPQEVAPSETPQVLKKWWFWTAVVVGATAVLLVLATRGPGQPSTRLGNMEAL